ncbi:efflux transporter outer membrane subunit [Candidatus Methylocalor cossyra]
MVWAPELAGLALVMALQPGCTVGPDFEPPRAPLPAHWPGLAESAGRVTVAPVDIDWWRGFGDPLLAALEERAATSNLSLRAAAVRLAQVRAQRDIVAAAEWPSWHGNAGYTRLKPSEKGIFSQIGRLLGGGSGGADLGTSARGVGAGVIGIPAAQIKPFSLWQYGFDAAWELDLWGRVRRELESAEANLEASAEAERDLRLSVMAEVARDYIELRRIQRVRQLTEDHLASAEETLRLTERRAARELVSDLDVAQARTQRDEIAAQLPRLNQQEAQAINRLSLLLGQPPRALRRELAAARPLPPLPPRVPIGLPAELARRRPDIRRAEAQLHAATAEIGVAVADFYPRLTLSGSFGLQALQFKDLGNWAARQYALGPTLTVPIFEGGRLKATLELREAQQQEAAIAYHDTVLRALHEVDDALTAYGEEQRRHDALTEALRWSREALDLARRRYQVGVTSFLPVLEAQRALLRLEQEQADSRAALGTRLVALYKALGGGFEVSGR